MTAIKNIVFDLGGVIIDLDRDCAVQRFIEMGVTDADELIDAYEQKGIFLEIENGTITAAEFCKKLSEHVGKELPEKAVQKAWMGFIVDTPQYKLDYILALKKEFKVYLLSNTNPLVMNWARTPAFTPAGLPLTDYFDKLYTSYELGITKPSRLIFERMLEDSGMNPSETLFVDDGIKNIEIARSMGFHTYLPINGEDWREPINKQIGK